MAILPGNRVRDNGVFGTTTDNPLTAGAATFNSARLADLAVVSGNHAIVTLDPLRQFGEPEIVMVTSHTAGATVATITRGMFGTTARSHQQGTLWVHAATQDDYTEVVTSGTRPTDQYRGERIYESDTNRLVAYSSANAWQQEGLFFDPPACRLYHNVNQLIGNGAVVAAQFNSELYDTDGMHNTAVNNTRIMFNTPGIYLVNFVGFFTSATDYTRIVAILTANIGGVPTEIGRGNNHPNTNGLASLAATAVYKFVAGDFVEVQAFQVNSAAVSRNLETSGTSYPGFSATWIGRGN